MNNKTYEVRVCESCGLRYPLVQGQSQGARCPVCMGATRVVHTRALSFEPLHTPTSGSSAEKRFEFAVLLDNIRSAWNVGSILRSADGFGFSHVYLCGITPTPEYEAMHKTSLGAENSVMWSHHQDSVELITGLKAKGRKVIALEDAPGAKPIEQPIASGSPTPTVLILGNEVTGIDPDLLDLADDIFYIPMRGEKKSLNVAIAFSVAAFVLQRT